MGRHKKFSSVGKVLNPERLYKTKRRIEKIIIHCSASPKGSTIDARDIDLMHKKRFGSRSGIGYHYVVKSDGTLEKGRWVDFSGAHARRNNRKTVGICYIGGVNKKGDVLMDALYDAQLKTLQETIVELCKMYDLNIHKDVLGHKELPFVNKACPCMDMDAFRAGL